MHSVYELVTVHHVDKLLETSFESMTKQERWHLIGRIEDSIDNHQKWLRICPVGSGTELIVTEKLKQLRLKRFQVWNSFYPTFNQLIRVGYGI